MAFQKYHFNQLMGLWRRFLPSAIIACANIITALNKIESHTKLWQRT